MPQPEIEYFYSAHSAYAWLGHARLRQIAAARGRRIRHRPVMLDPLLEAAGAVPFRQRRPGFAAYFFGREVTRWAEERGLPWLGRTPTHHHADYALANRLLIACAQAGLDADGLAEAVLTAHWRDDADLSDPDRLHAIAQGAGLDPAPLLAAARTEGAQAILRANTAEGAARSVFGSPTYFADGDMFYGQDRLFMLDRALSRPRA